MVVTVRRTVQKISERLLEHCDIRLYLGLDYKTFLFLVV
jgi:hypothetical protein